MDQGAKLIPIERDLVMDIHSTKSHSEQSGKLMGRRTLVKGAAWATPVVAATAVVPAYAASKNPCEYGTIVSVPWGERANRRRYKGTVNEEYEWAVMPTSNCSPQPQTYFIDNTTPENKLAYPWGRYEGVSDFPPIYPPNGKDTPDYTSKDGVGGVGGGVIINVRVENVAGDVSYAPTPTGADRFAFGESDANRKNNMYYAEGYKGKGANPPVVRLNDNYKGSRSTYIAHGKYNYLHFPDGPRPPKENSPMWTYAYGKHYTTAEGRDGWSWDIQVMANITHPNAGADVVSYMTYLRKHTYGDPAHQSAKVIPVQYRVIVTSPWGTVTYLSAAV